VPARSANKKFLFDYPGIGESTAIERRVDDFMVLSHVKDLLDTCNSVRSTSTAWWASGRVAQDLRSRGRTWCARSRWPRLGEVRPECCMIRSTGFAWRSCGGFENFQLLAACRHSRRSSTTRIAIRSSPPGAWSDLQGRAATISRIVDACITHDVTAQLHRSTVRPS
jgi:hypothetical protein